MGFLGRAAKRSVVNNSIIGSYVPPGVPASAVKPKKAQDIYLADADRSPVPEVAVNDNAEHWFAIVVKPGHEKRVCGDLRRASIRYYRPVHTAWAKHPKGRQEVERSLYPRYVFVANPDWFALGRVDGLAGVVCANGVPSRIPTADVALIAAQQRSRAHDVKRKVEVAADPLRVECYGKRIQAVTSKGVDMLMEFLGRGSVTMPANMRAVG